MAEFILILLVRTWVTNIPNIDEANNISNDLPNPASLRLVIEIRYAEIPATKKNIRPDLLRISVKSINMY